MRKTVLAAAMAASLTVGGAAGVALFSPTPSGAQTDETTTETGEVERPRLTERIRAQLEPLVDDGTIDDHQADLVAEHLAEQAPVRHGHQRGPGFGPGPGPGFGRAVLDVLDLDAAELRDQLASGRTLREVAEAGGVDVDALVEALLTAHEERLADAVAAGRLTQERADEREATFEDHVHDLLDRTFDGRRATPGS